mmetsp:Transcript_64960/g.152851  ORF Transcript_64960/g.152851 Transcript_64960/m.152851 type:complete len:546 (-) Transcript_64960:49-1686(-)
MAKRPHEESLEESPLFKKAKAFAADGRISHSEAKDLWADGHLTARDVEVLRHVMHSFRFTSKAASFMQPLLHSPRRTTYYRQVHGQRFDRELLDMAERFVKDGQISFAEAHSLWHAAQDGKGVTEVERKTLHYTLAQMKYTLKAAAFLKGKLSGRAERKLRRPKARKLLLVKPAASGDAKAEQAKHHAAGPKPLGSPAKTPAKPPAKALAKPPASPAKPSAPALKPASPVKQAPAATAAAKPAAAPKPTTSGTKGVLVKWKWVKRPNSGFPAFPVVMPRKEHRFSLVVCHPMGCYSTFFLGPEGLVKDLLVRSHVIRDYCKILCPGAQHIDWGKQWFRYRSNRGGTRRCHAEEISTRDLQKAVDFVSGVVSAEVAQLAADRVLLGGYSQGGCISVAVGLALPFDIGLIISQRGMLMKQTMDRHAVADAADCGKPAIQGVPAGAEKVVKRQYHGPNAKPPVLMTAGVLDDVYLLANQEDGRNWLQRYGCNVEFQALPTLDHYENSHEEHALVRKAVLATFRRAKKLPAKKARRLRATPSSETPVSP